VVLLVLHGLEDKLQKLLIDILHDFIEIRIISVGIEKNDLDDPWELLLKDLFDEFAGCALRNRLRRYPYICQFLLLGSEILEVQVLLSLPCHVIVKEMLNELAEPEECLSL
jgi:hypothetical protein